MMQKLNVADSIRYQRMTTAELREHFLLGLFAPGKIELAYTNVDRAVIGSAVPLGEPLALAADAELRAAYFLERRELGILNVGGAGRVTVDGTAWPMAQRDGLYVGRGSRDVVFESLSAEDPAAFYLLSYPAHKSCPTAQAKNAEAEAVRLGDQAACNRRTIYKYIHPAGIQSCQLVMGMTELEVGSVWNTMPCHTHDRRSEVYLYFGLKPDTRVVHLMGLPDESRHLVISDRQAVISPSWSIHSGVGTGAYCFCWGMGGENQAFDDMDPVKMNELR
jgi:4-deoxy-L-threo-5-hexosulose-uronate ketol-isomerase